ncbi:DUF6804 family protein [Capnocytophaga leadbetteri]|uniref:DUF6804 family protein n=1 Tax=Capnocytophaga leadbetteri TaxID=327575 RepID=UPI0028E761FA|nr:DUF6804 family protein [Capnocytophaga leadbetteri]
MDKIIKVVLAVLLLLCLAKMPYGYYILVRFVAFIVFGILAFMIYQKRNEIDIEILLYIALALLFQPFNKLPLGRTIWNIVDVIVGVGLVASLFLKTDSKTK